MKFEDIKFEPIEGFTRGAVKAVVTFPNGWGASVVRHDYTYGGPQGLFELAVLDSEGEINYSTSITDDVIGWLNPGDVEDLLVRIEALPPVLSVQGPV